MTSTWMLLAISIGLELLATSALKASEGFTRLLPSLASLTFYGVAFALLARALTQLPLGVAYAIWSGVGTATMAVVGYLLWRETLAPAQVSGIKWDETQILKGA